MAKVLDDEVSANRSYMFTDERNWRFGLHGGGRFVYMRAVLTSTSSSRERQRLNMKRKVGNDYRDKRRQGC